MPFNTYRTEVMQASLASDPSRQVLLNAFASWMDGVIDDSEISRHINSEMDASIRVALFAMRDQLRNNLDSAYATQCINRIADRRAQKAVRQLYAYGLDLMSPAIAAIRRNGGSAWWVPDDFGLTLGADLSPGTSSTAGWTANSATLTINSGRLVCTTTATGDNGAYVDIPTVVGKTYYVSVQITNGAATAPAGARIVTSAWAPISASVDVPAGQTRTVTFSGQATTTLTRFAFDRRAASAVIGDAVTFGPLQIREVLSAQAFTDSTGTTPVSTVGDVLGLLTDRSYGAANLGAELVSNGTFDSGTTGWTAGTNASMTLSGGELTVTSPGQMISTVNNAVYFLVSGHFVGRRYQIDFDATYVSGGDLQAGVGNTAGNTVFASENAGVKKRYTRQVSDYTAGPSKAICFASSAASTAVWRIDNISVREVLGNRATQPTTANKPIITQLANGKNALKFDGSNDLLSLSSGAILSQASDHWVTAAFVLDAVGVEQGIFSIGNTGNATPRTAYLNVSSANAIRCSWQSDAIVLADLVGTTLVAGTPYVATAAKIGSAYSLWLNGVLVASTTATLGTTTTNTANIGALVRTTTQFPFNGKLIHLVVDQGTLTDADRKAIERHAASLSGAAYVG